MSVQGHTHRVRGSQRGERGAHAFVLVCTIPASGGRKSREDLVDWVSWFFKWQTSLLPVHFHTHLLFSCNFNIHNDNNKMSNWFSFCVFFASKARCINAKLSKPVDLIDTIIPLPSALSLWVPSIFLGWKTKAKQPTPHSAVSHREALIAAPCADQPGIPPLSERAHWRRERNGWKLKDEHLKEGQQKTGFTE